MKFKNRAKTQKHFHKMHLHKYYFCSKCQYEQEDKEHMIKYHCVKCTSCKFYFAKCICESGPAQIGEEIESWKWSSAEL